ncbi:MAG TPA: hypothetical protein VMX18_01035 [Candidatus Bipolaricaulota bacterium]|nr:hypothetical protein [Candidatus Bipolaricaulota bacterium]
MKQLIVLMLACALVSGCSAHQNGVTVQYTPSEKEISGGVQRLLSEAKFEDGSYLLTNDYELPGSRLWTLQRVRFASSVFSRYRAYQGLKVPWRAFLVNVNNGQLADLIALEEIDIKDAKPPPRTEFDPNSIFDM